jgi:hypothetical protein
VKTDKPESSMPPVMRPGTISLVLLTVSVQGKGEERGLAYDECKGEERKGLADIVLGRAHVETSHVGELFCEYGFSQERGEESARGHERQARGERQGHLPIMPVATSRLTLKAPKGPLQERGECSMVSSFPERLEKEE